MWQRLNLLGSVMLLGTLQPLKSAFAALHAYAQSLLTVHVGQSPSSRLVSPLSPAYMCTIWVPQLVLWHA